MIAKYIDCLNEDCGINVIGPPIIKMTNEVGKKRS